MRGLRPGAYYRSIYDINLEQLRQQGFRAILLDLDNTMVPWNDPEPTPELLAWLQRVRQMGFRICIVSNNKGRRVRDFATRLGVPFVCKAVKPGRRGFRAAMALLQVPSQECVVVGDQLFTDILGGNRSGAHTILVVPIDRREFFFTRMVRRVERQVLRYLSRRGLLQQE